MRAFTIFPAIDLRNGQIVRLKQGDPNQQTTYGADPGEVARRWVDEGASWIHVVNLDGAFGEPSIQNRAALAEIVKVATPAKVKIQFGGGMRSLEDIRHALDLGVTRIILGTLAAREPRVIAEAVSKFGRDRIGVSIDARDGQVKVHGWRDAARLTPTELGAQVAASGVQVVVYTNIARDGLGTGVDVAATRQLAENTGLAVIASGGVAALMDVRLVKEAGLAGIIIGRALYDGVFSLQEALQC